VQQSSKFLLVLNLQTARALGIDVPSGVLATADEVIDRTSFCCGAVGLILALLGRPLLFAARPLMGWTRRAPAPTKPHSWFGATESGAFHATQHQSP
jgi:hypothetical protein